MQNALWINISIWSTGASEKGKGLLAIRGYDKNLLPDEYKHSNPDNENIGTAITERKRNIIFLQETQE